MVRVFEGSMGEWRTQVHILSGDLGGFLQRVAFKMHLEGESSHPQIKVEGHFQWGAGGGRRIQPPILFECQIIYTQLGEQYELTH